MTLAPNPPRARRRRWGWRAGIGLLWVLVAALCAVLSRGSLLSSHPAYALTLAVCLVTGLWLLVSGLRRARGHGGRRRVLTALGRIGAALGTVALLGSVLYLIPTTASPEAIAAMVGDASVRVDSSPTRITLTPTGAPRAGLVFQPGAKVDPRAYVPLLRQVAAQGYLVVIVQQPYDIGFLAVADPGNVISSNPTVARWAVGGHSLGGVAAAAYAGRQGSNVRGLLLWAAYPVGSLADRTDLVVASVSGTADGLTTPSDIEESRANLPPSTQFTAVEGAVHAYFGDYGEQSGDGTPTVDRGTAQQQIVAASTRFLAEVANG